MGRPTRSCSRPNNPSLSDCSILSYHVVMDTEQENHRGACVSCGFLSKHALYRGANPIPLPRSYEIDRAERMLGRAFEHAPYRMGNNVRTDLACYRKAAQLSDEVRAYMASSGASDMDAVKYVISFARDCKDWRQYTEGLSPQQHLEQVKTEELEATRQKLEQELLTMSQKVQHDSKTIADTSLAMVTANKQALDKLRFWVILLAVLQFVLVSALAVFLLLRGKS